VPPLETALTTVDSLRKHGQFRSALTRLDSLAQVHSNRVAVHWRRALLSSDLGKDAQNDDTALRHHRRALEAAENALATDSTSAWAHLVTALAQGRITLYAGRSERVKRSRAVKRHADRALALDSSFAPAYHMRGRWHRQVASLNFLERTLVKTFYGGLPNASYEQSVADFQRAIALESKPYNHLELGKTFLRMDRDEAARKQFQKALETTGSPHDAEYKREARSLLADLR
jgi:tetratricopeptide (TPR) repeat protein